MLAQANRVTRPDDFRQAVRRGRRASTASTVLYALSTENDRAGRFGFIVAKSAGGAVVRNRIRRRLRAASFELLDTVPAGTDIVVRGLAGTDALAWDALVADLRNGIRSTTVSA